MNNPSDLRQWLWFFVNWPIRYQALFDDDAEGQRYQTQMLDIIGAVRIRRIKWRLGQS